MTDEELKAAAAAFAAKYGNGAGAVEVLMKEARGYRQRIKAQKDEIAALQAKVPGDGAAVLSASDAKALEAYRALGKPEDVKKALDALPDLQGKVAASERLERLRKLATVTKADADVLAAGYVPDLDKLAFEFEAVKDGDKTREEAFVKDGAERLPFRAYVEKRHPKLTPALFPAGAQQGAGTKWPSEPAGGRASTKNDLVAQALERNRAAANAPNPLKPAAPAKTGV